MSYIDDRRIKKRELVNIPLKSNHFQFNFNMSRYTEKKVGYKAKDDFPVKFGFEYNEAAINYRTEIPPLPEKPKHKPDENIKLKKIQDVDKKIQKLKDARKEKKDQIKRLNSEYDEEINTYKDQVSLARKCILVLQFDIERTNEEIGRKSGKIKRLQAKVDELIAEVRQLKAKNKPVKRVNKEYQEMSNRQLDQEKARIEQIMSTKILSKKEEAELNSLIYKIQRLKQESNRQVHEEAGNNSEDHDLRRIHTLEEDIKSIRDKESKIKAERLALFQERQELQLKIEDIKEDISAFFQKLKEIADIVDSNEHVRQLSDESKALKEEIYKLRDEIAKINTEFDEKYKEYEIQQEKIRWIAWATKIQEKKREQWEEEKAERKKQKAREKAQTEKDPKQGDKADKDTPADAKPFERKKINRNQKEIDTCSFLIDYCKRLYPTNTSTASQKTEERKEVDIKDQLKKGPWAKEKGVEVLQSKKSKLDEEEAPKAKYNKKKHQKEEEEIVPSNRFSHDYFVAQSFDSVKIIPPTSVQELDKIIKDLEDKVEYYLSHPDESIEQKFAKDKEYLDKTGNNEGRQSKYTKSRGQNKSVINTQEFPSL